MFEVKMECLKQSILSACLFAYYAVGAQEQKPVDFTPVFKTGDKLVYQLIETKFKQNNGGYYLYLMYDTTYMVFNVKEKNDSQTLIYLNYADGFVNYVIYHETTVTPDYLRT